MASRRRSEQVEEAIRTLLSEAEAMIDAGECFDRKLTPLHKNRSSSAHLSVGKILPYPEWRRVRIVKFDAGEDAAVLVVKKLRLAVAEPAEAAGDEG